MHPYFPYLRICFKPNLGTNQHLVNRLFVCLPMEHHHDERLVDVVYLLNLYPGEKRTTWELDNLRSYLLFQGFLYYVFIVHNVHHVYRAYRLYVLHNIYVYICMCVYIVYDVYIIYNIYIYIYTTYSENGIRQHNLNGVLPKFVLRSLRPKPEQSQTNSSIMNWCLNIILLMKIALILQSSPWKCWIQGL